ncbi:MAG: hypothetical protein J6W23_04545 [Victivallales bacterium]|nr:hypothetical protein [Victivallales bacterium]
MSKKRKAEQSEALTVTQRELAPSFGVTLMRGENGRVCLPVKTELANDTAAQEAVVVRVLPQGVRREVLKQLQAEEERRSPAQWALIIAVLAVSLTIVWRYFPVQPPAESLETSLEIETTDVPKNSEYYGLYVLSKERFESQKYAKCASELAPKIPELLDRREQLGESHDRLLYYFFESVRVGRVDTTTKRMAEKYIDVFASLNHDEVKWDIMRIKLCAKEYLNVELLHSRLSQGRYKHIWQRKLSENESWIHRVRPLVESVERQASAADSTEETLENLYQLKYSLACLLTARWMLEGGKGKSVFPDDYGDPGVASREEAMRICRETEDRYRPVGKVKRELVEYLRLRKFIAETVLAQSKNINRYYWDGDTRFSNDWLTREIMQVNARLEKGAGQ